MQVSAGTVVPPSPWQRLTEAWRARLDRWIGRRLPPSRSAVLSHHNIFIVPSRQGLGFLFVLGLMFIAAVNYEANLAFALVFLLLAMFVLSIFHTFRNLAGLQIAAVPGAPVFAGEQAEITVILQNTGAALRDSIQVCFPGARAQTTSLLDVREQRVALYVPTTRRGHFHPGRLVIDTVYPFGLCRAWSLPWLDFSALVYPQPVACDLDSLLANQQQAGNTTLVRGNDDFHGLREFQRGDSLKHVAWKQYARGQGMFTKDYASNVDSRVWLHWDMFPGFDTEARLSRLCYCVLKLDGAGIDYGLELPGLSLRPAKGAAHFAEVLSALALHDMPTGAAR